jgi:hypothetical protein
LKFLSTFSLCHPVKVAPRPAAVAAAREAKFAAKARRHRPAPRSKPEEFPYAATFQSLGDRTGGMKRSARRANA